jgi:hypothetical protein
MFFWGYYRDIPGTALQVSTPKPGRCFSFSLVFQLSCVDKSPMHPSARDRGAVLEPSVSYPVNVGGLLLVAACGKECDD